MVGSTQVTEKAALALKVSDLRRKAFFHFRALKFYKTAGLQLLLLSLTVVLTIELFIRVYVGPITESVDKEEATRACIFVTRVAAWYSRYLVGHDFRLRLKPRATQLLAQWIDSLGPIYPSIHTTQ